MILEKLRNNCVQTATKTNEVSGEYFIQNTKLCFVMLQRFSFNLLVYNWPSCAFLVISFKKDAFKGLIRKEGRLAENSLEEGGLADNAPAPFAQECLTFKIKVQRKNQRLEMGAKHKIYKSPKMFMNLHIFFARCNWKCNSINHIWTFCYIIWSTLFDLYAPDNGREFWTIADEMRAFPGLDFMTSICKLTGIKCF